jgi:GntR family transcriptional regulator, phosphonate transport system regulatory protein
MGSRENDSEGLRRRSGLALWRQIGTAIENDIRSGRCPAGQPLPTERELAKRFTVARQTIRRAMADLERQGIISIEQGRGTFVLPGISYQLGKRTRFSANLLASGHEPSRKLLMCSVVPAAADVAANLELREGADVVVAESIGRSDSVPILTSEHWFPRERFPGLVEALERTQSISAALRDQGLGDYTRQRTNITTRLPTSDEARRLEQPMDTPVLVAESVNVDEHGRPVDYAITRFAGERVFLCVEP